MEMESSAEWGALDWFEYVVVLGCFFRGIHTKLLSLWYATTALIEPERILGLFVRACMFSMILSAYLMERIDVLVVAGFIGWTIFFSC